ncbi:hypothetical protein Taro_032021 [Colocasia esculenta]|uniref:Uncharacterized protein n=1 Tax=Colocasia esculenta TaxID=4460 RepID=A0A843VKA6_COLES|nr:hypothetical protein [Colocasia esculenta]
MEGRREFTVAVTVLDVVTAALPVQEYWLPMSNLDLLLPPLDVGVFSCYRKTAKTDACFVSILKKSLSDTLVAYHPFAGEVMSNSAGEPELLCNNRGVDFIEARCDVGLASLHLHDPNDSVMEKLMPKKKEGVLCVQATELKCGSLVVACSFDHRVADAYSANMFFVSWAEAARSIPFSSVPSFTRSLLSPRHPGFHDASIDNIYVPLCQLPPPRNTGAAEAASIDRIYYITASDIARIQAIASAHGSRKRTKLEAFTSYLWQVLGGVRAAGSLCSMGVVVDGRERMQCSMDTYFGNVLSIPYATLAAEELRGMSLVEVADVVHGFIARAATREHFMGLVDWVEAHRPNPAVSRICGVGGGDDGVAVVVSSGWRFPVSKLDFGWGRPVFASYNFPWSCSAGYVMPMPSAMDDGDWVVYVHLAAELVAVLETAAGDVFRPVTADYLGLTNDQ